MNPTVHFWLDIVLVAGFTLTALMCICTVVAVRQARRHHATSSDPLVWVTFAVICGIFALIKAQGLSARLGQWLRDWAQHHGAYLDRRPFQIIIILVIVLIALSYLLFLYQRLGSDWWEYRLELSALGVVAAVDAIRLISLHELDRLPMIDPLKFAIEFAAIALLFWRAWNRRQHLRKAYS